MARLVTAGEYKSKDKSKNKTKMSLLADEGRVQKTEQRSNQKYQKHARKSLTLRNKTNWRKQETGRTWTSYTRKEGLIGHR